MVPDCSERSLATGFHRLHALPFEAPDQRHRPMSATGVGGAQARHQQELQLLMEEGKELPAAVLRGSSKSRAPPTGGAPTMKLACDSAGIRGSWPVRGPA
jgi:hypothetical protein